MSKIIDDKIENLSTPWENYSGERVEEFIKEQFGSKAGLFHYDASNNRYMVFADKDARDKYLDAPQDNAHLLIAVFDAPFNYTAEISLITPTFNAVSVGMTGVYLEFTFDTKNKSGQSIGEDVICTFTFSRGSSKQTLSRRYHAGNVVRLCVDDYLESGTNNVTVGIVGQSTLAATTVGVTFQVVDLVLSDSLDISRQYDPALEEFLEVPYNVYGFGTKVIEWYVDGVPLEYSKVEDEIAEFETSRTKYISTYGFAPGLHNIQFRAYTIINGEKFYSNTLYRDFMVRSRSNKDILIAVGADFPMGAPLIGAGDPMTLYGLNQYVEYPLSIAIFNPSYAATTSLDIYLNDELITSLVMRNNVVANYNISSTSYGQARLSLKVDDTIYSIGADVSKSPAAVEEISQNLDLALSAKGKSNSASDRNKWVYGNYRTIFNGFQWLPSSGWDNGCLVISGGASIDINCAPLARDITGTGATFEFEFSTSNVSNNDAVVCDMRNNNGTGILITASEASLTSAGGVIVSTRYKPEENVRISFVINKSSGVVNKALVFLYVNGILSGAAAYAANDNFISAATVSVSSSDDAVVRLMSLRFYDAALTSDQILNNFILYRNSAAELLNVYSRNDIYEDGSVNLSVDKLSGFLPVMVITGNIPALEATTDKNLQIDVDVEFTNLQDPSRSFKIKNAALRPQGTSSMSYPKKNFRLYTLKKDNTILYDAAGNIVADKLYSFTEGAQPVGCWCLKADFAESSGSHNTGVARLWNKAMKNAQIDGEYRLRTMAQQAAIDSGYPYDVRTTVDGFPILVFYRLDDNSPLVFIGKYNFNNDKSTESVFGFCDVPGFDNSDMQCWEVLNNGHHLALFNDISDWDAEWQDAFEARYPDGCTDSSDLKAFASWMAAVSQEDFVLQKWDHLDVYKTAAYYVYLMRFGAVDQVVKNAMFTSEDGAHWFFINYDNDTICGLRNDGILAYSPYIDRQSLDTSFASDVYAFAGHDSRLWNMCEADPEFMEIVRLVDNALYVAGISYDSVIDMFDGMQSDKWCERVYNQDAQYKYIGPFTDRGVNNLFMLQGSRRSHRRWWLSERFAGLDAKYVSGEYKANSFEVKLAGAPAGLSFGIKAGASMSFGYGVNNVPVEYGVNLNPGDCHSFNTVSVLNVGDPLRIYASPYLEEIDVSNLMPYMAQISISSVFSNRLGTKLKKLVIGKSGSVNTSLTELSGIQQAIRLEELNIDGLKSIKSLDLSKNEQLVALEARNSGLTSLILPSGAPVSSLQLPASLQSLTMRNLYSITANNVSIQDNGCNLITIEITECPLVDNYVIVSKWMDYKSAQDSDCSLILDNVNWSAVDPDWLMRLAQFRNISLKGEIELTSVNEEQMTAMMDAFGANCFTKGSELFIKAPAGLYIVGPDSVNPYSSAYYEAVVFSLVPGVITLEPDGYCPAGVTYTDGLVTVGDITYSTSLTLLAKFIDEDGYATIARKRISIPPLIYPGYSDLEITGDSEIVRKGIYEYRLTNFNEDEFTGRFHLQWEISGTAVDEGLVELGSTTDTSAKVIVNDTEDTSFTLTCNCIRDSTGTRHNSREYTVALLVGDVIITKTSNPHIMSVCYSNRWAAHSNYMTAAEASQVMDIGTAFSSCLATTFNEFKYFVNVKEPTASTVFDSRYLTEISLPWETITVANKISFETMKKISCPRLKSITGSGSIFILESATVEIDAPNLEIIDKPGSGMVISANMDHLSFPRLQSVRVSGWPAFSGAFKTIDFPALREVSGSLISVKGDVFEQAELIFPELIQFSSYLINPLDADNFSLTKLSLPKLTSCTASPLTYAYGGAGPFFKALTEIDFPELTSLTASQFLNGCQALESIEFPKLTSLTMSASFMAECPVLANLEFPEVTELTIDTNFYRFKNTPNLKALNFPKLLSIVSPSNAASNWYPFSSCSIESVSMPLITEIPYRLFSSCSKLKRFNAPNLRAIADEGFGGCPLEEIDFMTSLESIGQCALTGIKIPELNFPNVTFIGGGSGTQSGVFSEYVEKISLPKVKDLPKYAFAVSYSGALTEVHLPSVESWDPSGNFSYNTSLKEVYLPNLTTLFDGYSSGRILYYSGVESFRAPKLTELKSSAFNDSPNLKSVEAPLATIANGAFTECPLLQTIILDVNTAPAISRTVRDVFFHTGTSVPEDTPKVIYTQQGATGFDVEPWTSLVSSGWTISYTLPPKSTDSTN